MFDVIYQFIVDTINGDYVLITETLAYFSFLDTPGIYIMMMVIGCVLIPFLYRSVYSQYANPHGYYSMSMTKKIVIGVAAISVLLLVGYLNVRRFFPMDGT